MSIGDGASGGGGDIDLFPPRNGAAKSRNNNDNNNNNNDASGDSDDDDESYIGPRPAPSSSSSGGGGGDEGAFSTARAWAARFMGRSSEATPTSSSASSASSGSSSGTSSTGAKNAIGGLALERSDSEEEEDDFGDSSDSEGSMNGAEDGAGEGGEGDDQDPAMHGEGCSCCAAACLQVILLFECRVSLELACESIFQLSIHFPTGFAAPSYHYALPFNVESPFSLFVVVAVFIGGLFLKSSSLICCYRCRCCAQWQLSQRKPVEMRCITGCSSGNFKYELLCFLGTKTLDSRVLVEI